MAARKKGDVETGLVQRPVVDAEFLERGGDGGALADAFTASQETIRELMQLMTRTHQQSIEHVQVLSMAFADSLKGQIAATKAQQELLDKKEDRRIARDREKRDDEFKRTILGDLRVLLPQVINRFSRSPVVSAPEVALLRPLIEGLSEKQIASILTVLTESQQAALVSILQAIPDEPGGSLTTEEKSNGAH